MLPTIRLDDENFIEIFERSRKMIPRVYPEWTDYNEHDPGITLLELFTWLKEMQQFYLDQIGTDNYLMYLKLLGVERRRMQAAVSLLQVTAFENQRLLLKGTKFRAGDTIFETGECETLEDNHIVGCMSKSGETVLAYNEEMINSGSEMNIPVFGSIPLVDDEFYIYFEKPFAKDIPHKIYTEILDEYEIDRNDFEEFFYPLADIELQYYTEQGYQCCEYVKDETHCFLSSGAWIFKTEQPMAQKDGAYSIRFVLKRSEYDVVPLLKKMSLNIFSLIQTDTLADYQYVTPDEEQCVYTEHYLAQGGNTGRVLQQSCRVRFFQEQEDGLKELLAEEIDAGMWSQGRKRYRLLEADRQCACLIVYANQELNELKGFDTNGFPYQAYSINDRHLLNDGLEIIIREKSDGKYHRWTRVEDFHCSKPEDRHFVFQESEGILLFGDCERGMAPEGRAEFIRYRSSLGTGGNIKKHKIDSAVDTRIRIRATNCFDISSGTGEESIAEAFERFKQEQKKIERCVTCKDYETLVYETPGLRIRKVKAITSLEANQYETDENRSEYAANRAYTANTNEIYVVVQPYSFQERARLSDAYYRNIHYLLERKRMIGTKISIVSPEYYGASVFVEVAVHPHYTDAKKRITEKIKEYFSEVVCEFGSSIIYNDIFGRIDAMKCVSEIKSFSITVQGKNVIHTKNENIIIPKNGLLYIRAMDFEITLADY